LTNSRVQVFVHLAYGFGGDYWNLRWKQGSIIGINEPFPYGYHHAVAMGYAVTFSQDRQEAALTKFFRLAVRAILGFDLIHAWRNFDGIRRADIVWTHTESQYLAILLLLRFARDRQFRPKLIAQSVWLFDNWQRFSGLRQQFFSWLIGKADILTVHSPENLAIAKQVFPNVPSELVLFGIAADKKIPPHARTPITDLHIVSLGNDAHRDWDLLIKAVAARPRWKLKIASQKVTPASIKNLTNVEIMRPRNNDELFGLYQWADILVLAIKPNLHASGITVIQEAALQGVPVVCADTGGLRAYFGETEVRFVPPLDAAALREAIDDLSDNPNIRLDLARNAQARMGPCDLSSVAFARRHVEISRSLLASEDLAEVSPPAGGNARPLAKDLPKDDMKCRA
jgi:glycosyltransferase involved in cell wall biosynthesis